MNRKLLVGIVSCIIAFGLHAETIRVLRFVPVAGSESEVAPENSQMMYQWLVSHGVQNAVLDTTSLTGTHLGSASYFLLNVMTYDLSDW